MATLAELIKEAQASGGNAATQALLKKAGNKYGLTQPQAPTSFVPNNPNM